MVNSDDDFLSFKIYVNCFSLGIWVIFLLVYSFLLLNFHLINSFFGIFDLSSDLRTILAEKIEFMLMQSSLTDIVLFLTICFGFVYVLWVIENKGFQIFEGYDIYGKHFQTIFYVFSLFNFTFILPFVIFLVVNSRLLEVFFIISLYLISLGMASWFRKYAELLKNYDHLLLFTKYLKEPNINLFEYLNDGKSGLRFLMLFRTWFGRSILVLMVLTMLFSIYLNYSLLTISYIFLVFLAWYFIICSVTKIPIGIFNVHLNSGDVFERVFITEEGDSGYIVTVHPGNVQKKVMKNSIQFMELSDPPEL